MRTDSSSGGDTREFFGRNERLGAHGRILQEAAERAGTIEDWPMPQWNPEQYLKFDSERTQPVRDLISHIALEDPRRIVDLGCGPGNSTEELRNRWPGSSIEGVDNSIEMIERARRAYPGGKWRV